MQDARLDSEPLEKTLEVIDKLRGLEAHSSYMISTAEMQVLKSLGINLTCEPIFNNEY